MMKYVLLVIVCFSMVAIPVLAETVPATTTFVAHFDGGTSNDGCEADYALGSTAASTTSGGFPAILEDPVKFGTGALQLDWWSGRSLIYDAASNYDNSLTTIEFQLNMKNVYVWDDVDQRYEFDGTKRYVFNDNIPWGTAGHVDMWIDGDAGAAEARLVVHLAVNKGTVVTKTVFGIPVSYDYGGSEFMHYAVQWDSSAGVIAVFQNGYLRAKDVDSAWTMDTSATQFKLGMQTGNVPAFIIDEFRISDTAIYDAAGSVGDKAFDAPAMQFSPKNYVLSDEYAVSTRFVAHYNGDTGNNGFDADYGVGGSIAAVNNTGDSWPDLNVEKMAFGAAAFNLPWWSGKSVSYIADGNYDNSSATIEFWLNTSDLFVEQDGEYLFDGTRRYIFNDDLSWGQSGHVDMWFEGTAGATTARLIVHVFGDREGSVFSTTLMGPPICHPKTWDEDPNEFQHYAVQWDASAGEAEVYHYGILRDKKVVVPWSMSNQPGVFKLGSQMANVPLIILDEIRVSNQPIFDNTCELGAQAFYIPWTEYAKGNNVQGDVTFDDEINDLDLKVIAENWLVEPATYETGDITLDGKVDIEDLAMLSQRWMYTVE